LNTVSTRVTDPHVSVVIPTRNRPEDVHRCLASMAWVSYPCWDVVVVDQSDDERTEAVVQDFMEVLPNLTYYHTREKGAARARNAGIAATVGEVIAFIDDDCVARTDWLDQVTATLQRYPQASLVFGAVESAPHDSRQHYITVYKPRKEKVAQGSKSFLHTQGLSANMCVCRDALRQVGLFDTCLGPGSGVFSGGGEDIDLLYRSLAAGLQVVYTPRVAVEHYGVRDYKSGSVTRLVRDYAYCSGAADMKLLRCGNMMGLILVAVHALYCVTRINARNLVLQRGPVNSEWITMYVRGLFASFQLGIDQTRRLYTPRNP